MTKPDPHVHVMRDFVRSNAQVFEDWESSRLRQAQASEGDRTHGQPPRRSDDPRTPVLPSMATQHCCMLRVPTCNRPRDVSAREIPRRT